MLVRWGKKEVKAASLDKLRKICSIHEITNLQMAQVKKHICNALYDYCSQTHKAVDTETNIYERFSRKVSDMEEYILNNDKARTFLTADVTIEEDVFIQDANSVSSDDAAPMAAIPKPITQSKLVVDGNGKLGFKRNE